MKRSLTCVEVEWLDSAFHRGWSSHSVKAREMSAAKCRTIGYLVEATRHEVKLVMTVADEDMADGITIPRCAVTHMRRVR